MFDEYWGITELQQQFMWLENKMKTREFICHQLLTSDVSSCLIITLIAVHWHTTEYCDISFHKH